MTQQQATPQTAAPQGPDPAALQAELAGFRQLAGALLGREIKPDETAGALSLQIAQQREADSRRALEMRAGIAEGCSHRGLRARTRSTSASRRRAFLIFPALRRKATGTACSGRPWRWGW